MDENSRKEIKAFLGERINTAENLLSSIKQRGDTLCRITEAIIRRQEEFFSQEGNLVLRPLTLQTIADDTDLHISTVSRAVNDKYLQCGGNTYALKYFFGGGVTKNVQEVESSIGDDGVIGELGSEVVSSTSIKDMIKSIVSREDKAKPLSDAKIVDALEEAGYDISRRTVAKYRDELGIEAASKRKRF